MDLYRFSPITDEKAFITTVQYVAEQVKNLTLQATGNRYPLSYLTLFSHYPQEHQFLLTLIDGLGDVQAANNGLRVALTTPIEAGEQTIAQLRIRQPDPYRTQVGCADLAVGNYAVFKEQYFNAEHPNMRLIERPDYEMIEFFDPDFDVFAYVVSHD